MRYNCLAVAEQSLTKDMVTGRRVLETGSLDVTGDGGALEMRKWFMARGCGEYVGVDMNAGHGADVVCRIEDLVDRFGAESFDIIVSVDAAEHFEDWRECFSQMKRVCKPRGYILIATVTPGYGYHPFPEDYWRWTAEDMERIFADCELVALLPDLVGIAVRKPAEGFTETDLSGIELFRVEPPE